MSYGDEFDAMLRDINPRSWEDVLDYYQKEYPGQQTRIYKKTGEVKTVYEWQGKLATDLSNKLGIKRASVMRRFQGERAGKVSSKQQAEYEELAEDLPPMIPDNGYHITGTIWVKYSEECVEREVDEFVSGEDAEGMIAADDMLQAFANYYNTGDVSEGNYDVCDKPKLYIEAVE